MAANPPRGYQKYQDRLEQGAADFFEPKLKALGLSTEQLEKQDIASLEESLARLDELIRRPEQLGMFRGKFSAELQLFVVPKSTTDVQVEAGALPILLVRKAFILDRIKLLRPVDQLVELRDEIAARVSDPGVKADLFEVLESQQAKERAQSHRLAAQTEDVQVALQVERLHNAHEVILAEIRLRVDVLEKTLSDKSEKLDQGLVRLEDKTVSKWDVVTVVFAVLAGIGGVLGAALGIARWLTG